MQITDPDSLCVTFKSAPNIALVKYWGKYNQSEIIPLNDSLGLTLNTDDISTTTTCIFSPNQHQDQFILNRKPTKITNRMIKVLATVRYRARIIEKFSKLTEIEWNRYHFRIESENSFPSASGMASSASGYSCLAAALNELFGRIFKDEELSRLARSGSGSAARSLYGGLVLWKGVQPFYLGRQEAITPEQLQQISRKSISYSIQNSKDLSFIKIIAVITQNKQKQISSTLGMKTSVQTSEFIKYRNSIANSRIQRINHLLRLIRQARQRRQKQRQYQLFSQFSQLVIKDSNSFHAVCLDSYPPIYYMNQFSKQIVNMINRIINRESKQTKVAYTFDAGPHGFLFVHEDMLESVLLYLHWQFGGRKDILNNKGKIILQNYGGYQQSNFSNYQEAKILPKGIWVTDVGRGPEKVYN